MSIIAQLVIALGEHAWSCVYDREQKQWCLWHNGRCILTSSKQHVELVMREQLTIVGRRV